MKKDDIPFLMDDVKNKMPVYTENTLKVKGNKLPKNMKEYVEKTNRKFLDNHLSDIEEYYHVFPEYNTKVFVQYQREYFSDDLNHDGIFTSTDVINWIEEHDGDNFVRGSGQPILYSNISQVHGAGGCNGPDLFDVGTSYAFTAGADDLILANKMDLGTVCLLYDRLAARFGSGGSGSVRLGVYDTMCCVPTNLDGETGSFGHVMCDFSWHCITEYSLSTTQNWVATNLSFATDQISFDACAMCGDRYHKVFTFAAFQNPLCSPTSSGNILEVKMGHS